MNNNYISSQNDILLHKLMIFYDNDEYLSKMLNIINGTSNVSLRIVDWFSTNYSKKNFTMYETSKNPRFKVYEDYKLKLKAYSKKRFDPFCRWERIQVPIKKGSEYCFETTIGQLNFFKWAIENNSLSKTKKNKSSTTGGSKTRKRREELSISAVKTFKKEKVEITVSFD